MSDSCGLRFLMLEFFGDDFVRTAGVRVVGRAAGGLRRELGGGGGSVGAFSLCLRLGAGPLVPGFRELGAVSASCGKRFFFGMAESALGQTSRVT